VRYFHLQVNDCLIFVSCVIDYFHSFSHKDIASYLDSSIEHFCSIVVK
jgi:hypothetical protein